VSSAIALGSLDNFDVQDLELGYIGAFYLARKTESGRYLYQFAYKAQISLDAENAADEGDETALMINFLANSDGKFYNMATN